MYQPSRCSLKGVDTERCASKDDDVPPFSRFPTGGRHEAVCEQMGVDLGAVPHPLEEGKSVSKDAGLLKRWIVMSHIGCEENKPPFIRAWKPSLSISFLN